MKFRRVEAVLVFYSQFPDGDVAGDTHADAISDALENATNWLPCIEPGSVSVVDLTTSEA